MRHLRSFFTVTLLSGMGTLSAQQFSLKEAETNLPGPQHELILCPGGDYIDITYHFTDDKDPITVTRFDPKTLTQRYTQTIAVLSRQHYRAAQYSSGHLFVFCSDKDGAVSRYELDDNTGGLKGQSVTLFNLEGKEDDADFFPGSSADKNYHYLVTKEKKKKEKGLLFHGVILDRQMNTVATFSYTAPEDRDKIDLFDFVQTNNGGLSLIYRAAVKTQSGGDYTPFAYTMVHTDIKGTNSVKPLSGLPAGVPRNVVWMPENDRLFFTAFISHEKNAGYTTFVSGSYDYAGNKVGEIHQTEINSLLTQSPEIIKNVEKNGLPGNLTLLKTTVLSDGSKMLVFECHSNYISPFASHPIYWFIRGDVYVLKLDKSNKPLWLNFISKLQREGDIILAVGTTCIADTKDNLHFFFYDNTKNTDPASSSPNEAFMTALTYKKFVLTCVSMAPDGKMKKQFIDLPDPAYRLMMEKTNTEGRNAFYFMAINTKLTFGGSEHLLNHANFRLGKIELN